MFSKASRNRSEPPSTRNGDFEEGRALPIRTMLGTGLVQMALLVEPATRFRNHFTDVTMNLKRLP